MAGHVLELRGCTPEPLGNYLKGLGVFRLIAEQADPHARAWWRGGVLHLRSRFASEAGLQTWFQDSYAPSALLAPWSVNSGLWPPKKLPPPRGDKRATPSGVLRRLVEAKSDRFRNFKTAVSAFHSLFGGESGLPAQESELSQPLQDILKDLESQPKKARTRSRLLRLLRNKLSEATGIAWLDAIGTVQSTGDNSAALFSILADGGTEGVNSFVGNYYGRLCDHLPLDSSPNYWGSEQGLLSRARLGNALFATVAVGVREADAAGGLYWPSLVEAPNIGQEFIANPKKRAQPWDFILAMEGFPLWSSAATRRTEQLPQDRVSFPFYCDSSVGGSLSLAFTEMPGGESKTNGEVWCPLWDRPASFAELRRLFAEGRLVARQRTALRATQFAVAVASLGVERGITAFQRVGLLERSGSGGNTSSLAIHLGTWSTRPLERIGPLDEIRPFEASVAANLQLNANQPRRLLAARKAFEESLLVVSSRYIADEASGDGGGGLFLEVLTTSARLEQELAPTRGKVKFKVKERLTERQIPPLRPLTPRWVIVPSPDATGLRLARAIAGIAAWGASSEPDRPVVEAIRSNLLPVRHRGRAWQWDETSRNAVWSRGAPLSANLTSVLRRRLIDAQRGQGDGLPLWSQHGATFADLLAYWNGEIDEGRLADLIHGLALIDAGQWDQDRIDDHQSGEETPDLRTSAVWFLEDEPRITLDLPRWLPPDELRAACALPRVYHLLKLCFVGGRLPRRPVEGEAARRTGDEPFPPDCLDVLSLLDAERLADAAQLAARRLRAKGYPALLVDPTLDRQMRQANRPTLAEELRMSGEQCRCLAAMMLIPVQHLGVSAALAIKPESTT